jgi:Fic family protein
MNPKLFSEDCPGILMEITVPRKDWAFVPHALPPKWQFPIDLWPQLAEAKQELARLDGIARTLPNPELLLRPLQNREALRSSSLEGTYATPQELLLFEMQPREAASAQDPINTHREVANYSSSLRRGLALMKELPFCLRLIREIHQELLSGVRGRDKTPGEFRKTQNHIGSDYRFNPPPPARLEECLNLFERALHREDHSYDPLVYCYLLHYQFEAIHPYLDGNGRVGRVLLSLMIYKHCQLNMPWLYMSPYFERYKDEYIDNLFAISARGDWKTWIAFCLRGTVEQAKDSISRCDALRTLREHYHDLIGTAGPRAHQIVEALFTVPVLNISDVARQYEVSYPTAKSDALKLVELDILAEVPDTYPKRYFCRDIFAIAFGEPNESQKATGA